MSPMTFGTSGKQPPFERPGIDLTPSTREWRDTKVDELAPEDVVSDVGLLATVEHSGSLIKLTGVHGNTHYFPVGTVLRAFVNRE